ncbi:MAG: anti-sigma factor [Gammaproteobacteria bacterium]
MNCAQFDWLVADIAAGRIEAGAEVRAHLARCDRCRAHLQAERRLTAALRDVAAELAPLSAPPAVEAALLARVQARALPAPRPTARRRRWGVVLRSLASPALAASVLALLSAVLLHARDQGAAAPTAPLAAARPQVATPFYPVFGAAQHAARNVVRVRVPRTTLAVFGLPYNPRRAGDPIIADLVVDNGGMVTAVRFVQ